MVVSGFTILRHAGALGYPFLESMRSALPLVDEFIAVVADDDEPTALAVAALGDDRVRMLRTSWQTIGLGGIELARQTNVALAACRGDWALYIQADEVLHEEDHPRLRQAMDRHLPRATEGLVLRYLHFYRSGEWVTADWQAFYPRAVRIVRTGRGVESAGDAAGFVVRRPWGTRGLIKADGGARMFHYGWAGDPALRLARAHRLRELTDGTPSSLTLDDLGPPVAPMALRRFRGTHPEVMRTRMDNERGTFAPARLVRSPAWGRAWVHALRHRGSFRGWARVLLPTVFTNWYWRRLERRHGGDDGSRW